jgi:hypothetical protein
MSDDVWQNEVLARDAWVPAESWYADAPAAAVVCFGGAVPSPVTALASVAAVAPAFVTAVCCARLQHEVSELERHIREGG